MNAEPLPWSLELMDIRRAEVRHSSSCAGCGSREPARIEGRTCSDCTSYPSCGICSRWVGDGSGWLPGYVVAITEEGTDLMVCDPCFLEAE